MKSTTPTRRRHWLTRAQASLYTLVAIAFLTATVIDDVVDVDFVTWGPKFR